MTIYIGTSGWSYDHWKGVLYRPGLPAAARLSRYVEEFDTVELNASFYRWPQDSTFGKWNAQLPDDFALSVKAHRGLTHFRRLKSPEPWVERVELAWQALGTRSKVLLVQLHPEQERDDARLEHFLSCFRQFQVAVELRHRTWDDPAVYALLERHGAAYVVTSGAGLACVLRATTETWSTCGCTARTKWPSTQAATQTATCSGGPTESRSGRSRAATSWSTSTTTDMDSRSRTLASSRVCWDFGDLQPSCHGGVSFIFA